MTYYHYIILNLKNFAANHTKMFWLMIGSEIIAIICLLFSYGLFLNTREQSGEITSGQTRFIYDFYTTDGDGNIENTYVEAGIKGKTDKLMKYLKDDLVSFDLYLHVTDKTGAMHTAAAYYSAADNSETDYVCKVDKSVAKKLAKNGKIEVDGHIYSISEKDDYTSDFILPYSCVSDDAEGFSLSFELKNRPDKERIEEIQSVCSDIFGIPITRVPEATQLLKVQINNMFYLYSAVIAMIVVLNLSLYFKYIFNVRKKEMRIFKMCGATCSTISEIFILETLLELIIGFVAATFLFKYCGLKLCLKIYPKYSEYYSNRIYLMIFGIYTLASLFIISLITIPYVRNILSTGRGEN